MRTGRLTFKRQACKELGLAPHVHLKVAGVDSAEICMQTVLMYWQTHLLALTDPHLLIQGQLLVADLVVAALLRCGVGMRELASSLRSCLPVGPRGCLELVLLVTKLRLVELHLISVCTKVGHSEIAVANHAQVLLLDAVEDLLLLLRAGAHVVGDVRVEVVGDYVRRLND